MRAENQQSSDECKLAGLAQLLGLVAALPVWLVWRKRSAFVRLHALQSMLLDVVLLVAVLALLALLAAGLVSGAKLAENPAAPLAITALTMFGLPICSLAGLMVVLTIVLLLRLRAAAAALKGQEYRYPLVGWKVESGK